MERPHSANRLGAAARIARAIPLIVSCRVWSATLIALFSRKVAICSAKRSSVQPSPGTRTRCVECATMTHRLLRNEFDHFEVRTNPPIYIFNQDTLLQTDPTSSRNQSRSRSTQSPPHFGIQADYWPAEIFSGGFLLYDKR